MCEEVLEDFLNDGEIRVRPEVFSAEVPVEVRVDDGAEAWKVGVGASDVCVPVQRERAELACCGTGKPVLLQVVMDLPEELGVKHPVTGVHFASVSGKTVCQSVQVAGNVCGS